MGRVLVPATMVAALLAFAVAALAAGFSLERPRWWNGAVHLAVLGGIIPMIYAVNARIVPVFARRMWPSPARLRWQVGLALAGAWVYFAGVVSSQNEAAILGSTLALAGGILFLSNVATLFRQPASLPAPPLPYPGQAAVDRIGTRFMRLAGVYLLFGLGVGVLISIWRPETGRWDLVWAHALLVGYFLSMVSGVCYHVLTRWTDRRWRALAPIQFHFVMVALGLPLMLLALATDNTILFAVAGPLQALAIALLLLNIVPMVPALPGLTRPAFAAAALLLLAGVSLGALFAIVPAFGARLRMTHAEINLFGVAGLFISGAGYYLVPRFAGQPLRWPRLAPLQLTALIGGVALAALASAWHVYDQGSVSLVLVGQALTSLGFLLFAFMVFGTFRQTNGGTVAAVSLRPALARAAPRRPQ